MAKKKYIWRQLYKNVQRAKTTINNKNRKTNVCW